MPPSAWSSDSYSLLMWALNGHLLKRLHLITRHRSRPLPLNDRWWGACKWDVRVWWKLSSQSFAGRRWSFPLSSHRWHLATLLHGELVLLEALLEVLYVDVPHCSVRVVPDLLCLRTQHSGRSGAQRLVTYAVSHSLFE